MVYPRENGLLSFSKFVAVCALVALQGASAQEVTTTVITSEPATAITCTASSGDIVVGVQAIPDASCKAGGLGCYSDTCRFCKYSETSNSAHLLACSSFGYNFPSLAPEPTTISAGDCGISEGDVAVGIRAVSDATCASGGLGCYTDHCRYCKEKETPQSGHLNSCTLYGTVITTAPATSTTAPIVIDSTTIPVVVDTTAVPVVVDTAAPIVVDTAAPVVVDTAAPVVVDTAAPVVVDTVAPVVVDTAAPVVVDTVAPIVVDTAAPVVVDTAAPVVVDTAAPVVVDTVAPVVVDTAAPVVVDTAAPVVVDTAAPVVVDTAAPVVVDTAAPVVVDTAAPVVVDTAAPVVVDTAAPVVVDTAAPVVVDTAAPIVVDTIAPVVVDPSVVAGSSAPVIVNTIAPVVIDTTPGTVIPNSDVPSDATTSAPVDGSASTEEPIFWQADQVPTECTADESFVILGIDAVADPTVTDSDFDFYSAGCRLCKTIDIPDYDAFLSCAVFPSYTSSGTTTTSPAVDATGSVATETLAPIDDGTLAPVDIVPTDDATPTCALTVSDGDAAVGIDIISDANCSSGGLGCIDSSCRFCKLWTTPQSTHLYNCTDLLTLPAETPAPTTECLFTVSVGDAAAGIDLITDASCANGGLGCHTDVCRYCKNTNTTLSAHLEYCSIYTSGSVFGELDVGATECSIDSSYKVLGIDVAADATVTYDDNDYYMDGCRFCKLFDTSESSTFTNCSSISGYGATPTCTKVVSSGDAGVGINITTDATCSSGGTGCIDSICRFCKVTETYQSAHLVNCSAIGTSAAAATPAPAATSAPGAIPLTCTATVTSGDASVGLSVVTDMSCGDGGVGCTSSICRLCRTFNTSQSLTYMNCSDVKYIDTSDINLVPIPVVDTTTTDAPIATTAAPIATTAAPVATTAAPVATTAAPVATTAAPVATTAAPVATTAAPVATTAAPVATTAAPATTTAAPTTTTAAPVSTCTETVSDGDKAVGLDIVTDVNCLTGGLGCISGSVCKFCKTSVTIQSTTYDYCPGYPKSVAPSVAPVLSALRVQDAGGNADSADTGLMAKVSEFVSNDGALPAFIAAAIGCVAVVAVVAVGARRVVRRLRRANSSDASASVEEDDSVLSAVTEDGAATATGVEDAGDV